LVPYSTRRFGSPLLARLPRLTSFRLQGLVTLLTVYSFRARVGSVSPRRRSWDSPFGVFPSRKVSAAFPPGSTHLPFRSPVSSSPKQTTRPNQLRLLGFDPFESPSRSGVCLAHRVAGYSLGFCPFQGILASALNRDFSQSPLSRFLRPLPEGRAGRRLRVSIGPRLASSASGGESIRGRDSPLRVFAPVHS
jgi:hypothetical protein